jgi:hypothetical protein
LILLNPGDFGSSVKSLALIGKVLGVRVEIAPRPSVKSSAWRSRLEEALPLRRTLSARGMRDNKGEDKSRGTMDVNPWSVPQSGKNTSLNSSECAGITARSRLPLAGDRGEADFERLRHLQHRRAAGSSRIRAWAGDRPPRPADRRGGDHDRPEHRRSRTGTADSDPRGSGGQPGNPPAVVVPAAAMAQAIFAIGAVDRRLCETAVLVTLRKRLRGSNIWVVGSRDHRRLRTTRCRPKPGGTPASTARPGA